MSRDTTILKREELYEKVWARPVRELAKEHGISDVALAKICQKLEIPRPGRGYWARKAAGKSVKQDPLPPASQGVRTEYRISSRQDLLSDADIGEEARTLLAREQKSPSAIIVHSTLTDPHHWIQKSAGTLRQHSKHPEKALLKRACLDIRATRATLDRALRVADSLLKALEERGFRIEVTDPTPSEHSRYGPKTDGSPSRTGVHLLGSFIEFRIEEGRDITKIEPPSTRSSSSSSDDSWVYTPPPEYRHDPNGKLALKIKSYLPGQHRKTWSDGKRQRVETCLNSFVLALIHGAERSRLARIASEKRKREWEVEQRRREDEARRLEMELTMRVDLDSRLDDCDKAARIFRFIKSVESSAQGRGDDLSPQSELGAWLSWARGYATALETGAIETVLETRLGKKKGRNPW